LTEDYEFSDFAEGYQVLDWPAGVCWTILKMTFGDEKFKPIHKPHNNNETRTQQMTMTMTHVSPTTIDVLTNTNHEQDTNHG
jgi:hypothetical protein